MDLIQRQLKASDMPIFPEFSHLRRFWMPQHNRYGIKVLAGDYYVTNQNEHLLTVLGSCVTACIRDPNIGVGGINHFLLPDANNDILSASNRYGVFAMEQLINAVIKHGGQRHNLEIKLVGGGKMIGGMNDIGQRNIDFVKNFMTTEGFEISAQDLGGVQPRKIIYNVITGKLLVQKLKSQFQERYFALELEQQRQNQTRQISDDVELFD